MAQTHETEPSYRLETAVAPRWYLSPKWVRAFLAGQAVVDSKHAHLLREGGPPKYYFPRDDVAMDRLTPSGHTENAANKGDATYFNVEVDGRVAENAAWTYADPVPDASFLKDQISFDWPSMDAWFEEKEEVFVHARDPFKRIDSMKSSRHVRVVIGGEPVADSSEPVVLYEPGHPIRYYLPKADVRMDLLRPSERRSRCAYKGEALYYSVQTPEKLAQDVAWYYPYPTPETAKIAGMLCFFNERVDELYVDGELAPRPKTAWSQVR